MLWEETGLVLLHQPPVRPGWARVGWHQAGGGGDEAQQLRQGVMFLPLQPWKRKGSWLMFPLWDRFAERWGLP